MHENLKASLKLLLLVIWIALWYPPVWIAVKLKKRTARDRMVRIINNGILRIVGVRLLLTGQPADVRPLLLVTNHISYLDIPILASHATVRFTPKSEIAGWPVIGAICRLCDAVFVDRRPEKVVEMKAALQSTLNRGDILSLFPEASTGNGLHMLPFKSGFFSLAEEAGGDRLTIQPAAITYTHVRRLPIDTTQWPSIAWYGDMELAPHLWNLLKMGSIDAELVYLPPVTIDDHGDRKKLAAHCQRVIDETVQAIRSKQLKPHVGKRIKFQPRLVRLKP